MKPIDALAESLAALRSFEVAETASFREAMRQQVQLYALVAIAQELHRLNERTEAAKAYADVQRQVAEYAKGAP